ncbi:MAG: alpha-L-fucosidase [Ferruginibacter sp.]
MKKLSFAICLFLLVQNTNAQTDISPIKTDTALLKSFMEKRFGMFVHWGPVTLRGGEIGWHRGHGIAVEDYDSLYKEFDPVLFNAKEWVKTMKDAGMKYMVFVSRHHDGFCMWPSKYSDYTIAQTPYKKDLMAELSKACREQGIAFGIYFSILDWHDKLYPNSYLDGAVVKPTADMKKFIEKIKNQITELVTNYHPFLLWFDGQWEGPWTTEMGKEVYAHIKKLDKNIIVNNRLGKGAIGEMTEKTVGDYLTPEQKIGKINMQLPWESCITIGKQWSWGPNEKIKSTEQSLKTLISTAGGNGNLLYNIGPMMDGRMEARQIKVLDDMGKWLKQNGEAIYATNGGPYTPNSVFTSTRKGKNIFITLLKSDTASITLPAIPNVTVLKATVLNGKQTVPFKQSGNGIELDLTGLKKGELFPVVVLETNVETLPIPVIEIKSAINDKEDKH